MLGPMPKPEALARRLVAELQRAGHPKRMWDGATLWLDLVRVPPSGTWDRRRADLYGQRAGGQELPRIFDRRDPATADHRHDARRLSGGAATGPEKG